MVEHIVDVSVPQASDQVVNSVDVSMPQVVKEVVEVDQLSTERSMEHLVSEASVPQEHIVFVLPVKGEIMDGFQRSLQEHI